MNCKYVELFVLKSYNNYNALLLIKIELHSKNIAPKFVIFAFHNKLTFFKIKSICFMLMIFETYNDQLWSILSILYIGVIKCQYY